MNRLIVYGMCVNIVLMSRLCTGIPSGFAGATDFFVNGIEKSYSCDYAGSREQSDQKD